MTGNHLDCYVDCENCRGNNKVPWGCKWESCLDYTEEFEEKCDQLITTSEDRREEDFQEIAEKPKTTVKVVDAESLDSWIALGDSLDLEAGWDDCVHWLQDCEHCSGDITSEHSEDWKEVVDNREGCFSGVSEVSDRKREERRFHENEKSAAMWRATWQMQQLTSSGHESVICPSSSQWKQNISGHILAMTRPIALTAGWGLIFAPQAHEVPLKTQKKRGQAYIPPYQKRQLYSSEITNSES